MGLLLFWPTRFSARLLGPIVLAFLLLAYTILVVIAQDTVELFVVARHARLAFSVAALALLVRVIPGGEKLIVRTITYGIRLHAAMIFLQILLPSIRAPMGTVLGLGDRAAYPWRAFGLSGSYDAASFIISVGMIIALNAILRERRPRFLLELFVLWGAGIFTGRTFWIVGSILLGAGMLITAFRGQGKARFLIIGAAACVGVVLAMKVWPFLMLSLFPERYGADRAQLDAVLQSAGYYSGTAEVLISSIRYPEGVSLFLGRGDNPLWTDFGYLKIVVMNGVVGLAVLVGFHAWIAGGALRRWYRVGARPASDFILAGVFVLLLAYNVKLLLLGSRAASELFMLLGFARWSYPAPVLLSGLPVVPTPLRAR